MGVSRLDEYRAFDAEAYLARYPDLREAVRRGELRDAWTHYDRHGRDEGRTWFELDVGFYTRTYPQVALDLEAGLAADAREHYVLRGRALGYLPHPEAPRATFGGDYPSAFGGLWIDHLDAPARIAGRRETGQLTAAQADLLQHFTRDGYVILEGALPEDLLAGAEEILDEAFDGGIPELLFECHELSPSGELVQWRPEVRRAAAKALDLHYFGAAILDLIFAPAVTAFLDSIFEARALASQTLGFLRGSGQAGHHDSSYVPYTHARSFSASWIALEDVAPGAGELFYYPGSHRLPDVLYDGYKSVAEARRMAKGDRYAAFHVPPAIEPEEHARQWGLRREVFAAKRGDVLFWHADLIHGGAPVSTERTRKSIVTHYCPRHLVPLLAERKAHRWHEHRGHLYTSGHYSQAPRA